LAIKRGSRILKFCIRLPEKEFFVFLTNMPGLPAVPA